MVDGSFVRDLRVAIHCLVKPFETLNSFHSTWTREAISHSGALCLSLSFHSSVKKKPVLGILHNLVQMLASVTTLTRVTARGMAFLSSQFLHWAAIPSPSRNGADLC